MSDIFENFLKRNAKEETRTVPRDLFQAVVFYFRPIIDEINLEDEEKAQEILKETPFYRKNKIKYVLQNITEISSKLLNNKRFVFPFYSEDIFMSPKEAEDYIPRFIKKLIGQNKLPANVIKDHTIDYDMVETGIVPLNLATLEKISEFKNTELKV